MDTHLSEETIRDFLLVFAFTGESASTLSEDVSKAEGVDSPFLRKNAEIFAWDISEELVNTSKLVNPVTGSDSRRKMAPKLERQCRVPVSRAGDCAKRMMPRYFGKEP